MEKAMIFSDYTTEDLPNFDAVLKTMVFREAGIMFEGDNRHLCNADAILSGSDYKQHRWALETVSGGYYVLYHMQGIKNG